MNTDDELNESKVRAALRTMWLGRPYLYVKEIGSTNDRLKEMARDPTYPAGLVLLADHQSAGRGRLDRRWEAPHGTSLLFSVLLRPRWPARRAAWLTMLAGLAVAEAIETVAGLSPGLKWPNDVMLEYDDEWRKVCGLLLDVALDPDGHVESAILGVGLNVNQPAGGLPDVTTLAATSLFVTGGRPISRLSMLTAILERLERRYDAALDGRSPAQVWSERLITLGRSVQVTASGSAEALFGVAEATDEWGQLLVRDAAGTLHTIAAGDVTLRGL